MSLSLTNKIAAYVATMIQFPYSPPSLQSINWFVVWGQWVSSTVLYLPLVMRERNEGWLGGQWVLYYTWNRSLVQCIHLCMEAAIKAVTTCDWQYHRHRKRTLFISFFENLIWLWKMFLVLLLLVVNVVAIALSVRCVQTVQTLKGQKQQTLQWQKQRSINDIYIDVKENRWPLL